MTQQQADVILEKIKAVQADVQEIKEDMKELRAETRDLRTWRDRLAGALGALSALVLAFGAIVLDRF